MPSKNEYHIVLTPDTAEQIDARGENRSFTIRRDLDRLYTLYQRNLPRNLTEGDACLIVDVLNGTIMDANNARMLWAEVEDGCSLEGLAEKWEVDGPALVEKLKQLNDVQALAVVDAAEGFWTKHDQGDMREIVREVFRIRE